MKKTIKITVKKDIEIRDTICSMIGGIYEKVIGFIKKGTEIEIEVEDVESQNNNS